ncbi:MAG: hypothetical protein C5B50_14595 [Verrucomicrobia bacterium]|nr:MAG: hypothetical protein C5B50_14595 [Verrucomicrobiota bacterium]
MPANAQPGLINNPASDEGLPRPSRLALRPGDIQFYSVCDNLTEGLIYLMVLFSPWAFGTTQAWSIWVMNVGGYSLGLLLLIKLAIRYLKGYAAPCWGEETTGLRTTDHRSRTRDYGPQIQEGSGFRVQGSRLTTVLAILTVAILAYCLISALNARVTERVPGLGPVYRSSIGWLPRSYDAQHTWFAFWTYLGLACSFWAVRDWLLGKTAGERQSGGRSGGQSERQSEKQSGTVPGSLFPARLRRLLWVLSINGGLLALEGIFERLCGSTKLLFIVRPRINPEVHNHFGPWAYRANAAEYFNLLWPVCLAFWWTLHRTRGFRHNTHHLLLLCAAAMAACPIISTSRGGAIIALAVAVFAAALLLPAYLFSTREGHKTTMVVLLLFFTAALSLGFFLGWKALKPRMAQAGEGLEHREEMYELIRPMADDYPLFGTGPGTFATVFQDYPTSQVNPLYSCTLSRLWPPAQVHNDWLETRITFGILGSCLIALAFLTVAVRWFVRGGIHGGRRFMTLMWLAMGGCLVHARFDFPFQIHSIVFLFLIFCAMIFNLSRRG